jgi:hypothetical protein
MELAALAATCALIIMGLAWWRRSPGAAAAVVTALFCVSSLLLREDESWASAYAYGRLLAPLHVLSVFAGPWPRLAAALTMPITLRVLTYYSWQALGILGFRAL